MKWLRTNLRRKCPICGKPDWCLIHPEGTAVICMRTQSPSRKEMADGTQGWIHDITGKSQPRGYAPEEFAITLNVAAIMDRYQKQTHIVELERTACELGVRPEAVVQMEMAWCAKSRAWAFPMRDGKDRLIGIRLRTSEGKKFAIRGSRSGIFIPRDLTGDGPLLIVEGPTDTAAALTLGYDAIGRPSCSGGGPYILTFLRQLRREVVIFADIDQAGRDGAVRLADQIAAKGYRVRIITPLTG